MSLEMVTTVGAKPSTPASESRKIRKPLMEKRRRARINQSLNELKRILLASNSIKREGARPSKLEKADILEMTVRHLHRLQQNLVTADQEEREADVCVKFRAGFSECAREVRETLGKCKEVEASLRDRLNSHLARCFDSLGGEGHVSSSQGPADSTSPSKEEVDRLPAPETKVKAQMVIQTPGGYTLLPTKLPNGDLAFVIPADFKKMEHVNLPDSPQNLGERLNKECPEPIQPVWRPW